MTQYIETATELINAIEESNLVGGGIIELKPNTLFNITEVYDSGSFSKSLGLPEVSAPLSIIGNNSTIDWGIGSDFLLLSSTNQYNTRLRISDITFRYVGSGADSIAIRFWDFFSSSQTQPTMGLLEVINCNFEQGPQTAEARAIVTTHRLIVDDCNFKDNYTNGDGGGAISVIGSVTSNEKQDVSIRNSTFESNHAAFGGAIAIGLAVMQI